MSGNDVIIEEENGEFTERQCRSPSEGSFGDDEMKQHDDVEEHEERKTTRRKVKKAVSIEAEGHSDEEKPRSRTTKARSASGRTFSSSEDESKPRKKVSLSKMSIRDRKMSFEHQPEAKPRTSSYRDENKAPRRGSRHGSTTASDADDHHHQQTAAERRNKWEKQASKDILDKHSKIRAHGGSTGAATLKERFENKAVESKKVVTSSPRALGIHHHQVDGAETDEHHSAHSLKARFEAKIKDSAPVKRNFVINRSGGAAKKFGASAPSTNKCQVCTKTVYPMERIEADSHLYHKFCFKCKTCSRTVSLGNYAALQGEIYCKPHLKQLFKLKGNYDEGFGREQRKVDWIKKDPNATPSPAASQVEIAAETNGIEDEE